MRTLSFRQLLDSFMGAARVGRQTLQAEEEEQMGADLNAAALWLWTTETHSQCLPDMLTGTTVTLAAEGIINAADIEDADFWSVWQSDPRAALPGTRNVLQLAATALGNGDVAVTDRNASAQVFVLYKNPVPRWTTTKVVDGPPYAAEARVWWEGVTLGGSLPPDGHVYLNITGGLGDVGDIQDPAHWAKVTLPQSLENIIVRKANYERLRLGSKMPENAGRERAELVQALEAAFLASEQNPGSKPWLYNQNQ